jgi:class 3 adenylate cyclase/putative methionine-R-sulfoxide reductase with GAF domain
MEKNPVAAGPGTVVGRAAENRKPVYVADVEADPHFSQTDLAKGAGFRAGLAVPLLRGEEIIGVLTLAHSKPDPFTADHIERAQTFADQAAIAIENARLHQAEQMRTAELTESLKQQTATADVLKTISRSAFDLQPVLDSLVASAAKLCDAPMVAIHVQRDNHLPGRARFGYTPQMIDGLGKIGQVMGRGSLAGRVISEAHAVHIPDVAADAEYTFHDYVRVTGTRSMLGVPLLREGRPIGLISLYRTEARGFTPRQIELMETFADHAVIAIENVRLFQTVERQKTELARFAPQVADLLSSDGGEQLLAAHRREITALFFDLRGFTSFAETAEPEEVFRILRDYHTAAGEAVVANGGTIEHFAGDGLMAFFNDPVEIDDHELAAVRTASTLAERFATLAVDWRKRGYDLGLGIGIATGYATLGRIGFEGRYEYGAIGNAVILASRLSDAAEPGEILLSQRTDASLEGRIATEPVPVLRLKGFTRPVVAMRFLALSD